MSDSDDSNEYTVVDQATDDPMPDSGPQRRSSSDHHHDSADQDDADSKHRRSRRRESKSKSKNMAEDRFDDSDLEDNSNSTVPPSRYEEDEDYQEPKKKRGAAGAGSISSSASKGEKKKSKSKRSSRHASDDDDSTGAYGAGDDSAGNATMDDSLQRSVPPLKIRLPPREKSKRSKRNKDQAEDSSFNTTGNDDDADFEVSSRSRSKATVTDEPSGSSSTGPTRRSERIFVSNAKKVDSATAEEGQDASESQADDMEDFKIIHKDHCQSCRQGGELILCDYCPRAYHKVCLDEDLSELPDDWCCPHCQKNGKPDPKELRQQQAAMIAKKKKKQQQLASKLQPQPGTSTSAASSKPKEIENRDYCEICNQCGELLLCDTCPRAYHLVCMDQDAKSIPSGTWSCPYCQEHGVEASNASAAEAAAPVEEKPEKVEKIFCKSCRQTGGSIVFCATCPTRYHIGCLNPPLDEIPEVWHCLACSVEPLKGKVQRIITWRWKKQVVEQEPDKANLSAEDQTKNLLKSLKNRKPREREFFVKWKDMSYWHSSWIDEGQLQVFHGNLYRFYTMKNDLTNPPVFDESGMMTTNMADSKSSAAVNDLGEPNSEEPTNEVALAASRASRHRRRKRAHNFPQEIEDQYMRFGVRPEWLLIHRIVNHRKSRGKIYYLIKWRDLPYEEVTAEPEPENCDFEIPDYQKKIDDYWSLRRLVDDETATACEDEKPQRKKDRDEKRKKDKKKKTFGSNPKTDPKKKWETQPDYIPEPLKLHDYQMDGINWLRYSWSSGIDTILADEMGLGKTIQTVTFLYSLYKEGHSRGPFLIAAPLSTIINWERELEDWAPDFYVVNYTGNKDSRVIIRENELSFEADAVRSSSKAMRIRKHIPVKFHVLLTSYELINLDSALLGSIDWKVLVVDEAHRLKSNQSLFFRTLNQYNVGHKLLLTGTPLQNNLEELFNLLNFLSPGRFSDMDGFLNEFADIAKEEQVKKLHELLGPHLLRRLKSDVLTGMPAKSEFIVRVDLAPLQKKYYKYILTRNFDALNTKGGGKQVSLLNVVMDLKKCCNHPYLFPVAAEEAPKTKLGYFEGNALVKASGKLIVLQKMMRKLKEEGHRVLIFSQMTHMLDILEDFLEAEGYKYERIDGSVTGSLRQEAIDRFNAPNAKQFCFLLSTRAGGLGINLATADTVFIYDSDWNPHNDIQALSRAHRIGQTNKVMIYRFVTRNSVEERITQVAKKKMMLTHLVVRPGLGSNKSQATMTKQELDDILKFGTEELFKEEETKESEMIHYDDKAIDELLDRSQEGIEQKEMWSNEYLSSFKVASYQTKEADDAEEETEEMAATKRAKEDTQSDPHYWEKLLGAHYMQFQENMSRSLGKGKRIRKQVNYMDSAHGGQHEYQNHDSSADSSDFSVPSDVSENDEDFDEKTEGRGNQKSLRNKSQPIKEKMPPLFSATGPNTEVLGFTPKHRKLFLDLVMRFGLPSMDQNVSDSQFFVRELKNKPEKHLRAYTSLFINHLCEPGDQNSTTFEDGVPKEGLNVTQVLARIGIISLIKRKVHEYESKHGTVSMKQPPKPKPAVVKPYSSSFAPSGQSLLLAPENGTKSAPDSKPQDVEMKEETAEGVKEENKEDIKPPVEKMEVDEAEAKEAKEAKPSDSDVKEEEKAEIKKEEKPASEDVKMEPSEGEPVATSTEETGEKNSDENGAAKEEVDKEETEDPNVVRPFDFNIQDGGLTELHTLWYFEDKELKPKREHEIWNRRHDYWLLAGIVKHGYERWSDISGDDDFSILNEPFRNSGSLRDKFMERRLRLLEQALVFEEQLRRFSHLANQDLMVKKPEEVKEEKPKLDEANDGKDGETAKTDEKEAEDLSKKTENGDINEKKTANKSKENGTEPESTSGIENKENDENQMILNPMIQRACNQLEDLLIDMKSDCARIPQTVQRIPSIANRLQLAPRPSSGAPASIMSTNTSMLSNRM